MRAEFEEFQENSRELEAELETSLEQTENKNKDLQSKLQRIEEENDSLKVSIVAIMALILILSPLDIFSTLHVMYMYILAIPYS